MRRNTFKEFESSSEDNYSSSSQPDFDLQDSMFRCFVHWYIRPTQSTEKEKQALQTLAQKFNAVLCIWRIITEDHEHLSLIDLKAIGDLSKLPEFIDQALEVSPPTLLKKKFRVLSICIINQFGSFEAEKCYSVCENCQEQEKLNECCGQFICAKCSKTKQGNCPYCSQKLEVCAIPLEMVTACQAKHIYQPMFTYLTLEERFELMDMIEQDFESY